MSVPEKTFTSRWVVPPVSRMCFAISSVALGAALLGALVNHFLTGWMAVGGMAMVGLLYLGMGLAELTYERQSTPEENAGAATIEITRHRERRPSDPEKEFDMAVDLTMVHWNRISESVASDG